MGYTIIALLCAFRQMRHRRCLCVSVLDSLLSFSRSRSCRFEPALKALGCNATPTCPSPPRRDESGLNVSHFVALNPTIVNNAAGPSPSAAPTTAAPSKAPTPAPAPVGSCKDLQVGLLRCHTRAPNLTDGPNGSSRVSTVCSAHKHNKTISAKQARPPSHDLQTLLIGMMAAMH